MSFLTETIQQNEALFRLIYDFNLRPSGYVDESRLASIGEVLMLKQFLDNRRVARVLSDTILRTYQLDQRYCFDFRSLSRRYLLLDAETISGLLMFLGLAACSGPISRVILAREKKMLVECLGKNRYGFAVKRAPLIIHNSSLGCNERVDPGKALEYVGARGKQIFEFAVSDSPQELLERFELKFPETLKWDFSGEVPEETKQDATMVIRKILTQEFMAQWRTISS